MSDSNAWVTIKRWIGACAANTTIEELKASLEKGEKLVWLAQVQGTFSKKPNAGETLKKAGEAFGEIKETLDTIQDVCLDLQAVTRIYDAIVVLEDEQIMFKDSAAAAKAFGDLFVGFGRLCRHLPSPAKEWGEFLEQAGDLFVNWDRFVKNYTDRAMRMSYGN